MEPQQTSKISFLQSKTAKIILIGLLSLFMLIPLALVQNLIRERSNREREVTLEVNHKWGDYIHFIGPVLKIPYKKYNEVEIIDPKTKIATTKREFEIKHAYFFPDDLNHTTQVDKVTNINRSLYNPTVFKAKIDCKGNFKTVNLSKLNLIPENVLWDQSQIIIKTTNLKSLKSELKIQLNGEELSMEALQDEENDYGYLESTPFTYNLEKKSDFSFSMLFNGSNHILFSPIGKTTSTFVQSDWESPNFLGNYSANNDSKSINSKGFKADWKILHINRPFPQQYLESIPNLKNYSYGVELIKTVNEYQQNERASKYGFIVIGLTFLIFFIIQNISKKNIHLFQYTMIGLALVMFYTLLISITEHSSFTIAYIIASLAVIIMLLCYSIAVLKEKKFPFFIATSLSILYAFIFVIIQLESYALLVGSIGLFFILGAVMYFSKKIDWNN